MGRNKKVVKALCFPIFLLLNNCGFEGITTVNGNTNTFYPIDESFEIEEELFIPLPKFVGQPDVINYNSQKNPRDFCIGQEPIPRVDLKYTVASVHELQGPISTIKLTPDGKYLLYRRFADTLIYIHDIEANQLVETIRPKKGIDFENHLSSHYSFFTVADSSHFYWLASEFNSDENISKTHLYSYNLASRNLSSVVFDIGFLKWGDLNLSKKAVVNSTEILATLCNQETKKTNALGCVLAVVSPSDMRTIEPKLFIEGEQVYGHNDFGLQSVKRTGHKGVFRVSTYYNVDETKLSHCETIDKSKGVRCENKVSCFGELDVNKDSFDLHCDNKLFSRSGGGLSNQYQDDSYYHNWYPSKRIPLAISLSAQSDFFNKGLCRRYESPRESFTAYPSSTWVVLKGREEIIGYDSELAAPLFSFSTKGSSVFDFQSSEKGDLILWTSQRRLGLFMAKLEERK
ncbi:MAG: hypothetical protein ABJ275_09990 [Maricaulaceae bacterium]